MDKNSTPSPISFLPHGPKQAAMHSPSTATLARIRQFARSYVYFQQTSPLGGIILN